MSNSLDIDRLETTAKTLLGVPWVDNSFDPAVGLDCWSLVWHLYDTAGVTLPRNLWAAKPLFIPVDPPGEPGDILHFWPPNAPREHLGVRLRTLRFVDCNWGGNGVAINDLTRPPWVTCLKGAWRYQGGTP